MKSISNIVDNHSITLTSENVKKFATRLKTTLKSENIEFKTSKCYDILAKTFGSSNWHELSQHLNKKLSSIDNNDVSTIPSIFDLHWIEFQFFISEICKFLNFNSFDIEITNSLLEIVKDRKYAENKSYLNFQYLNNLLESDIFEWLDNNHYPINHYLKINPDLNQEIQDKLYKVFVKCMTSSSFQKKIMTEQIVKCLEMIKFLNENNFIVKIPNQRFEENEFVKMSNNNYIGLISEYPLITNIIKFSEALNIQNLSFHDLLIYLFLKKIDFRVYDSNDINNFKDNFINSLFNNSSFCSYLFSKLKNKTINKFSCINKENNHIILCDVNYINYYESIFSIFNLYYKEKNSGKNITSIIFTTNTNYENLTSETFKNIIIEYLEENFKQNNILSINIKNSKHGNDFLELIKNCVVN